MNAERRVLVIDNDSARQATFDSLGGSVFQVAKVESLLSLGDLSAFDLAIVDFDLDHRSPPELPVFLSDGTSVSTGIGVMSWLRERESRLELYAVTDRSASHAPWFWSAASMWFDASPLDSRHVYEGPAHLRSCLNWESDVLGDDPANDDVELALPHFERLMNVHTRDRGVSECLPWLAAYAALGIRYPAPSAVAAVLAKETGVVIEPQHRLFALKMARVQAALAGLFEAFGNESAAQDWPALPTDHATGSILRDQCKADIWAKRCPVSEVVHDHHVQLFATSKDVHAAMADYRRRGHVDDWVVDERTGGDL